MRRSRSALALLTATVVGVGLAASTWTTATAVPGSPSSPETPGTQLSAPGRGDRLDATDRQRLASAERAGKRSVTLLIAADPGRVDTTVDRLRDLGASITTTVDAVDYVQAVVPLDRVAEAAALGSVTAVDVDGLVRLDDPRVEGAAAPEPQTPPGASTPRVNPYLPTGDMGAAQFTALRPAYDGRNVTIAVLDSGIDLDHPALARTSRGERKIVDWYDANATTSGDGTWVALGATAYTGTFTVGGSTYTAPTTGGPYRFGLFTETAQDLATGELQGDVNRDGDRADAFGVLVDPVTKAVLVDLDQDGDFGDETAMTDYRTAFDVGHFGSDDPATPIVERVAFVVQTDKVLSTPTATSGGFVGLGIAGAAHGSHVAGIAAGNDLFGGRMDGVAPGATLMAVKVCLTTSSCTSSGLIDGVLYAATHGADVANISIGGLPALNDGNNARTELYNRTIAEYGMQLFISAGNSGAGVNTVGDPAVATDAIAVGSSITKQTWLSNYGSRTARARSLHPFSSRGPREDGGFKPQLVAPGSAISTIPQWQAPGPVAGTYDLPPGYAMFNGTSMAAPEATGAAALLISAYKATHGGARPSPAALRSAMTSTATFLSGVGAYEQGAGLVDVPLAAVALALGPKPDVVTTSVPVSTVLSGLLSTPGVGVGIHDREGVSVGRAYTRTYTLTRTTGSTSPVTYLAGWTGNDGTFSLPRSRLTLPLNTPVAFDVRVNPRTAGIHSALLRLDNLRTVGIDVTTLNTVVAPTDFTAAGGYTVTRSGTVERNQAVHEFVRVPAGATALRISMTGGGEAAGAGQVRFLRYDPTGIPIDATATTNCYNPDGGAGCSTGSPTERTVLDPVPGVWEIVVESRRTSDAATSPWSITASILGATVSPDPDLIDSATVGTPVSRTYSVTNALAAFTGRAVGGPLASVLAARPAIAELQQTQRQIAVPAGSTSLTVTVGNPSDAGADLDLFLFNCTTGSCVQAAVSADADAEESVTVANPAAGVWISLVDGYAVPTGTTDYDYLDSFTNPGLGSVTVTDADALRPSGTTWTVPGVVAAAAVPTPGRQLRGQVRVVTSDGAVVGSGQVTIGAVTTG